MQSKNIKIIISDDNRYIEVIFTIHDILVKYFINLPERYPFLRPIITTNIPEDLNFLYADSADLLDLVLEEPWSPAVNLEYLIEEIYIFSLRSFSVKKSHSLGKIGVIGSLLFIVMIRAALFTQSYSGHYTPPLYGDYEAQRHWMEITVNFPTELWYKDTYETDPAYWKIDYPPLTAWHSFFCGILSLLIEPDSMKLFVSRGYYTQTHLLFMRTTVLVSELLVYIPAVLLFCHYLYGNIQSSVKNMILLLLLLSSQMVLIDYGHFQYNNVMLGLGLLAMYMNVKGYLSFSNSF